ncbi:hypothetical protein TNCV_3672121 [Trichonephila clavipes]|nr:hypothetical protein TNCV_3672121 [Trichonephila clavipes]
MILCVAELLERSKKGKNNRCCQGSSTSLTALFHGCGSFKTTGMCSRRHGGGHVRSTTPAEEQIYRLSAKEQAHHSSAGGKSVSCCLRENRSPENFFARRLREGGLYARRPVVCVPLTRQCTVLPRLQWCREHHNWTEQGLGMRTILR